MPKQITRWYGNLSPREKLLFASLTALMGEEAVAVALVDVSSIDELFESVAQRIYAS